MNTAQVSERALLLAPLGRDAAVAGGMLAEAGIESVACGSVPELLELLNGGVGFVIVTEEALANADLHALSGWINAQQEWSDLPFVLLTRRGGGLERNPSAARFLGVLGNVTFLERPFHPTTLISVAQSSLRARRRQYEARLRLQELSDLTLSLEERVRTASKEREAALAQLHEAQKLETLGQLTGGVAHDFNNLLTPITGVLDLLNRRFGGGDPRTERLIGGALESAERARTLVQRLLGFARRQALQTRPIDLAALMEGMRDLIASSVGPSIEVQLRCTASLPAAMVDPNQLELAVLNLCVNARDAMPEGGVLTLSAEAAVLTTGEMPDVAPGQYLRLSVADTGTGMDAETLQRAVEPFYSTKEIGKGTGLGLSMVHGLASQLGGGFRLRSTPGEGTCVDLWLPVAADAAVSFRTHDAALLEPTRPLSILLVDDEPLVRTATAEMLRELGHSVREAAAGADALAVLPGLACDIVVTDYKMPRMDGAELAERIKLLDTRLPVLLITGYTGAADLSADLPRLDKPFRRAELHAAINRALEGRVDTVAALRA
ncbi:response regulator [Sphingomonas sp. IC-56]|uniref:response regulator n=1 Tax=Sphingomonas sp. IC-56 TaxID=2898529 RepID=UPI001E4C1641|nr:response regulator [Sphingomonas sp. IC-56]MCD2323334.1 response regulator [Sphingomonas sp. IC-56]